MSKYPEELKGVLEAIGIDPDSVEIHAYGTMGEKELGFSDFMQSLKTAGSGAINKAKNVSRDMTNEMAASYLRKAGFDENEVVELMKKAEENKKKAEAEAQRKKEQKARTEGDIVGMTLKTIAAAHGYTIKDAVIRDGKPCATILHTKCVSSAINIIFNDYKFEVAVAQAIISENRFDEYISDLNNATSACRALNMIDWRSWPVIED